METSNRIRVSIIIPTYNEEFYLPKLLECLKRQTYQNLEIIVSDGDSSDFTLNIAKHYNCKVVKGGNVAVGRNNGAVHASGELLCFMDSDVLVDEYFIENAINEVNDRGLDISSCEFRPITNNLIIRFVYKVYNLWIKLGQYLNVPRTTGSCIFVTKPIFNLSCGFDSKIKLAEDHSFGVKCSKLGNYGVLNSCVHFVSIRRVRKEGLLKLIIKSILCELHLIFIGDIKHDRFNYHLDGYARVINLDDKFPPDFNYFKRNIFT